MWSAWIAACLLATPSAETAAQLDQIRSSLKTGSLIFSQGDCLAVKVFSGSRYTHVAAVVIEDGRPVVYDAMNGPGVRRSELRDYLGFLVPSEMHLVHPATELTPAEAQAFAAHLQSQLGRPYCVHHHVSGQRADGVHCAEYLTDALIAANLFTAAQPSRVSPGSLLQGVRQSPRYVDGGRYTLKEYEPPPPPNENWREWTCRETSECCAACCRKLSRWFLCRSK